MNRTTQSASTTYRARQFLCVLLLMPLGAKGLQADDTGLLNTLGAWFGSSEPVRVTIAEPFIEMRTGPGRGYPVFYIAERGEQVDVLKERTDWYKIRTRKGKEGWVFADALAKTLDSAGQPLAIAPPDYGDYLNRTWEGGMLFGDFGGANVAGVYGSYYLTRNLSTEVDLSQFFGSYSDGKYITLSLVHQPFPEWAVSPFFTLGGGTITTEPKATLVQAQDRTDNLLDVGVGVRYYLTRRFLVRAQYKNYVVLTSRDSHEKTDEWKIGFSAFY